MILNIDGVGWIMRLNNCWNTRRRSHSLVYETLIFASVFMFSLDGTVVIQHMFCFASVLLGCKTMPSEGANPSASNGRFSMRWWFFPIHLLYALIGK